MHESKDGGRRDLGALEPNGCGSSELGNMSQNSTADSRNGAGMLLGRPPRVWGRVRTGDAAMRQHWAIISTVTCSLCPSLTM